eukprot:993834-Prymnesium_polylepis.2
MGDVQVRRACQLRPADDRWCSSGAVTERAGRCPCLPPSCAQRVTRVARAADRRATSSTCTA